MRSPSSTLLALQSVAFSTPVRRIEVTASGGAFTAVWIDDFHVNPTVVQDCLGDLNHDGEVSLSDLAIQLSNFGTPAGALPDEGDIDGDGDIDLADLAIMLSAFGTICP